MILGEDLCRRLGAAERLRLESREGRPAPRRVETHFRRHRMKGPGALAVPIPNERITWKRTCLRRASIAPAAGRADEQQRQSREQ